jgi:hypothetical protein
MHPPASVSVMTEPSDKPETPPPTPPPYPHTPGQAYPPPPPAPYSDVTPGPPGGPRNGLGIGALVVAIIGLLFCWSIFLGVILGIVAVVMGFAGRARVKRGEANNGGVAMAGILLGFLSIVAGLAFIAIYWALFTEAGGQDYLDCLNKAEGDSAKIQQCSDAFREHVEERYSITLTPTPTP